MAERRNTIFKSQITLADDMEIPENTLVHVLLQKCDVGLKVLQSLALRRRIPPKIIEILTCWLQSALCVELGQSILKIFGSSSDPLLFHTFSAIAARLEDQAWDVRVAAIEALGGQSNLPERMLGATAARLKDQVSDVRVAATEALGGLSDLPEGVLGAIVARLEDQDPEVGKAAVEALSGQPKLFQSGQSIFKPFYGLGEPLPFHILAAIVARLEHRDSMLRKVVIEALGGESNYWKGCLGL